MPSPAPDSPPLAWRHWSGWVGVLLLMALARLPWSAQRMLGRGLGRLLRATLRTRRDIAARNLALCLPELDADAQRDLLSQHFAALGIGVFEFPRAWW